MDNGDIKLLQLIQEAKNGDKSVYDKISNMIIDEVYNLVSFVYKKEETRKKLAKHIIIKIIRSVDEFDSETMDIHMWIARFTTIEIYNVYTKQNGNIFNKTSNNLSYEYNSIDEDVLFQQCAAQYNRAFIDVKVLNKINDKLSSLTKAQKIIYEMFCYECFSIDEIEDALEVDSTYIIDTVAALREQLCVYQSQEVSDNSVDVSEEEAYELNNIYSNQSDNSHSKYYKILSRFSKKTLISAACCGAVIVLAVVVFIVVSIRNKNSVSNVANYGQMSTKGTTLNNQSTTTVVSTKKDNDQTTKSQNQTETKTDAQTTKGNSGNNQGTVPKTQGNNTSAKPSSNGSNNPTQKPAGEPVTDNPTENDPSQDETDPTDNDPSQDETDPTNNDPSQDETDPTNNDPSQGETDPTDNDPSQGETDPTDNDPSQAPTDEESTKEDDTNTINLIEPETRAAIE